MKLRTIIRLNDFWHETARALPSALLAAAMAMGMAWVLAEWMFPR